MTVLVYEDFEVGMTREFGDHLVTKQEIIEFAEKYDPHPFHLSEEEAAKTHFGALASSGWMTCAIMMRMVCDDFLLNSSSVGSPGVDELRWLKPVFVNDRLRGKVEVVSSRLSESKPDLGIVRYKMLVFNQKDEMVLSLIANGMFLTRAGYEKLSAEA